MNNTQKSSHEATDTLRLLLRQHYLCDESQAVRALVQASSLDTATRSKMVSQAESLVQAVRDGSDPAILESFLAEYGLSSEEGVALMCLAEALLRVPDAATVDTLIHDKIVPADWGQHLGSSSSSLVNASTWALMLTGKLIDDEPEGIVGALRAAIRRLGEPVVRTAVSQAIKELGSQFVLGETIDQAINASKSANDNGYTYSYDMLGEAARTEADAKRYHLSYSEAIATLGNHCIHDTVARNPGISVKLSALYSRYEVAKRENVMIDLVARTRSLAMLAKSANMGFNIDAEEADRLDLSLDVIEAVLAEPSLAGWNGFGIVVQAYSPRAWYVLDWLYDMASRLNRNIMVRLVKGAYWDTEIKRAQVLGLSGFPVFTRKQNTDISYIACAKKLLGMTDRIYPQFATHNAHSVAAILTMATDNASFEFQRLHGMGEALHREVLTSHKTGCRIYAPVGAHEDLLAYLVRRLLENGANSSFVNQIVDETISAQEIAADPFALSTADKSDPSDLSHPGIKKPAALYQPDRQNSKGWDLTDPLTLETLESDRLPYLHHQWTAQPLLPGAETLEAAPPQTICNPADATDIAGQVSSATDAHIELAFTNAATGFKDWSFHTAQRRAIALQRAADLYEIHSVELLALATREAGKTIADGVAEIREAVDFLRYYACEAIRLEKLHQGLGIEPRGTIVCISPWNFPLAIFSGQIAAALATGNAVIAKPAEQTPLIATRAVQLMHEAGIPGNALQLLPGTGAQVGAEMVANKCTAGVC
ncbi:MAG: bifunctional proline dehydrogenase/L-glutamate gamma-semialdehyde dehydrogenase PutA, partial [Granulosicoccus sp.]|nr:bifunctional proline dehydrogenase/L-glutamate gamma-semialdehyde dehydrogenase PutA [Granulosicoccus sp.]